MGRRVGSKEDSMGKMGNNLPPKRKGGLGIKDVRTFNKALLGKWRWDMLQQNKELWARILEWSPSMAGGDHWFKEKVAPMNHCGGRT